MSSNICCCHSLKLLAIDIKTVDCKYLVDSRKFSAMQIKSCSAKVMHDCNNQRQNELKNIVNFNNRLLNCINFLKLLLIKRPLRNINLHSLFCFFIGKPKSFAFNGKCGVLMLLACNRYEPVS